MKWKRKKEEPWGHPEWWNQYEHSIRLSAIINNFISPKWKKGSYALPQHSTSMIHIKYNGFVENPCSHLCKSTYLVQMEVPPLSSAMQISTLSHFLLRISWVQIFLPHHPWFIRAKYWRSVFFIFFRSSLTWWKLYIDFLVQVCSIHT